MLSLAGGVLGLVFGMVGIRALLAMNTADLPRVGEDGVAGRRWTGACSFSRCLVSVGTGRAVRPDPRAPSVARRSERRRSRRAAAARGTGFRQNKARSVLVVVEVALALVLLVGSALLIRTAVALRSVDPGFDARNVLTMRMSLTGREYQKVGRRRTGRA